ncbi:hypothetical protein KM915_25910 [Cytobacillus oceanisediminis]|uniref:hypothetical protein n=1 Tax=Cytobacillus oceanisediminis TaxID=665099 RepID=UPI001C21D226|nr:hypothetical protein [Cytobacillus oceanisediminis]MBU8733452.1 hypothetical protein [Cytobacillus oceanisediminis]
MCKHGTYVTTAIINPNQNKKMVAVDACIAEEVRELNKQGVVTLGSCCGHGKAGQIAEWENGFGKWKCHESPPHVLINERSVNLAKELGYVPYPYYYADAQSNGVWQMHLRTGCITEVDVIKWHETN